MVSVAVSFYNLVPFDTLDLVNLICKPHEAKLYDKSTFVALPRICVLTGLRGPFFLKFGTRALTFLGSSWSNGLVRSNKLKSGSHGFSFEV